MLAAVRSAALMGIDINQTIALTFLIGGALAGAAGLIFGLYNNTAWFFQGFRGGLMAFTAAVLGGIGNLPGAYHSRRGGGSRRRFSPSEPGAPMTPERWNAVDAYFFSQLHAPDAVMEEVLAAATKGGLPDIHVSPAQGKLLHLLAKLQNARRILEVGTLAGYSSIWMARALPADGKLITLEIDSHHAQVAKENIARAGLGQVIDLRQGAAIKTLPTLLAEGPFDLVFIDADKPSNPDYFRWAIRLGRKGTLIVVDNVVRKGEVINGASEDASVQGVRQLVELIAGEPRVSATALQTVGVKGYDGIILAVVVAES